MLHSQHLFTQVQEMSAIWALLLKFISAVEIISFARIRILRKSRPRSRLVSRSQTPPFFLHTEGKGGSGQRTLSRLFCFPKIIGGVGGGAI